MKHHILYCSTLALLLLLLSAEALAQSSSNDQPTVGLDVGTLLGATYTQSSSSPVLNASDSSSPVGLTGEVATATAYVSDFRLELGILDAKGKGSYYQSRQDTSLAVGYQDEDYPWIVPTFGYVASSQSSDRTAATAPVAFIDKTAVLSLGLRTEWVPFDSDGNGLKIEGSYDYLTSGEAAANFGNRYDLDAGYVYEDGSLQVGVMLGVMQDYLNASQHASGRHVRETVKGNVIKVFIRY